MRFPTGPRAMSSMLALILAALLARPASSQTAITVHSRMATRDDLERLRTSYEQLAASTAYGEQTRAKARAEVALVSRRLRDGDFRTGDRIHVRVEGPVTVDDTVVVVDGPRIQVRGVRSIELAGVLRAELATKVATEVSDVVRNATVSVRPLARIAVFGAVAAPGFHAVPPETTFDQLLTRAGGPTDNARVDRVRVLRGKDVYLDVDEVMAAVARGETIDELDVRDGDVLEVPRRDEGWQMQNTLQLVTVVLSPIITFLLLR